MTPKQISHLLTESLQPGQLGVMTEDEQWIILTNRGTKIVADAVEEDIQAHLFVVGIRPMVKPNMGQWRGGSKLKNRHPNFWRWVARDKAKWRIANAEYVSLADQYLKEALAAQQKLHPPKPEIGAEESLPDEDVFAHTTGDDTEYRAQNKAWHEIFRKYNFNPTSSPKASVTHLFDVILTIHKDNVVRISKGGKILLQQVARKPSFGNQREFGGEEDYEAEQLAKQQAQAQAQQGQV